MFGHVGLAVMVSVVCATNFYMLNAWFIYCCIANNYALYARLSHCMQQVMLTSVNTTVLICALEH